MVQLKNQGDTHMRIGLLTVLVMTAGCGIGLTPGKPCSDVCDDNNTCTEDLCAEDGTCTHPPAPKNGKSCGNKQVCDEGSCVVCEAGLACTPKNSCVMGIAYSGLTTCASGKSECVLVSPLK